MTGVKARLVRGPCIVGRPTADAAYQPFILAMQLVTVACLAASSPPNDDAWRHASLVPFALMGSVGGFALYRRRSTGQFQAALSELLVVSGVGLLARAY